MKKVVYMSTYVLYLPYLLLSLVVLFLFINPFQMLVDEPNPLPPLRAQHSREQTFVLFQNTSPRYVNLYWIDYQGSRSFYAILRPGASIKANTFVTHPWVFRDSQTGEYLQILRQEIYWPQVYRIPHPTIAGQWTQGRRKFDIHLPVDSLSRRCLWKLAQRIKDDREGRFVLDDLPVPVTLIKELRQTLSYMRQFETDGVISISERYGR